MRSANVACTPFEKILKFDSLGTTITNGSAVRDKITRKIISVKAYYYYHLQPFSLSSERTGLTDKALLIHLLLKTFELYGKYSVVLLLNEMDGLDD
jgi:hypothetical protein